MFGWLFINPEDELIDIQARIDAIEQLVASLGGSISYKQKDNLEELYYRRNKIKALMGRVSND